MKNKKNKHYINVQIVIKKLEIKESRNFRKRKRQKKIKYVKKMDSIDLRLKDKKMQSDKDKIKEREEKNVKTMERKK